MPIYIAPRFFEAAFADVKHLNRYVMTADQVKERIERQAKTGRRPSLFDANSDHHLAVARELHLQHGIDLLCVAAPQTPKLKMADVMIIADIDLSQPRSKFRFVAYMVN